MCKSESELALPVRGIRNQYSTTRHLKQQTNKQQQNNNKMALWLIKLEEGQGRTEICCRDVRVEEKVMGRERIIFKVIR